MFSEAANTTDHNFHKYAGDYTLFQLGTFDQGSAQIQQLEVPTNLGLAITHIERPPAPQALEAV